MFLEHQFYNISVSVSKEEMWSSDKAVKGHSCEHDQHTLPAKRRFYYTGFAMMHGDHVRSDQVELVTSTHRPDRQDIWRLLFGGDVAVTCSCTSWLLWLNWAEWFNSSSSTSCRCRCRRWQSCNAYRYVLPGHACGPSVSLVRMNSRGFHAPTARPILHRWEIKRETHSLFAWKLHFAHGMRTIAARDYKFYQTWWKVVQEYRHIMIMCIHCVCTYLQCIEILLFIFKQMLLRLTYIYYIIIYTL